MEDLLQVGAITQTHGIRGEVKVFPLTDDVGRFKKGISLILDLGRSRLDLEVETVKFFKQFVILKFKGYDSINEIEKFVKKNLYVTRENAVKLKKDEYFIADLIGMTVKEEDGAILGTVSDVLQTGANDVCGGVGRWRGGIASGDQGLYSFRGYGKKRDAGARAGRSAVIIRPPENGIRRLW